MVNLCSLIPSLVVEGFGVELHAHDGEARAFLDVREGEGLRDEGEVKARLLALGVGPHLVEAATVARLVEGWWTVDIAVRPSPFRREYIG